MQYLIFTLNFLLNLYDHEIDESVKYGYLD